MNDAFNLGIFLEHAFGSFEVAEVYFLKSRTYACNLFDTVEHIFARIREVVNNDDIVSRILQLYSCVGTYEAGSASNKNCLFHFIR